MVILAGVDGEAGSYATVQHGRDLAQAVEEELVVMHVRPETDTTEEAQKVAQDVVDEAINDEGVTTVGRLGEPDARILREADDRDARYIVLGSRKQTPVGKAIFGSVAQVVLLNTNRAVVVVSASD